ncbi:hypothetical protein BDV96DRAFT_173538, partial [Lophiotrema nucula]
ETFLFLHLTRPLALLVKLSFDCFGAGARGPSRSLLVCTYLPHYSTLLHTCLPRPAQQIPNHTHFKIPGSNLSTPLHLRRYNSNTVMAPEAPPSNNRRRSSESQRPRRPSPRPTSERLREPDSPTLRARTLPSTATLNELEMLSAAVEASKAARQESSTKDGKEERKQVDEDGKRDDQDSNQKPGTKG